MYEKNGQQKKEVQQRNPKNREQTSMLGTEVLRIKLYHGFGMDEESHRFRILIHFLVIIYGMGACIGINGVVAEVPLLVISAPEGTKLPVYLTVVASAAYLVPAIYALCVKFAPRLIIKNELAWISGVLILGILAMGLLAFFHDLRTSINGIEYSTAMQILFFAAALCTGSRNVLLLPYLQKFGDSHLISFYIGEGLSGFFPSVAALIQGVGGNPICSNDATNSTRFIRPPKFPPRDFFLFVTTILVSSAFAFWALEYVRSTMSRKNKSSKFHGSRIYASEHTPSGNLLNRRPAEETHELKVMKVEHPEPTESAVPSTNRVSKKDRIYLYVMLWLVCFVAHGYLNTAEAYSSRPYGNSAHNLVVNLSQLASTAACTLGFWMPPLGIRGVTWILVPAAVGSTYVTWLALSSPSPLWHGTSYGVVQLVIIWIVLMGLVAYAKLAIIAIFYQEPGDDGLYVAGSLSLLGTICGAASSFFLINYTALFTPYIACELHR